MVARIPLAALLGLLLGVVVGRYVWQDELVSRYLQDERVRTFEYAKALGDCSEVHGAFMRYVHDHDRHLPNADTWQKDITPYLRPVTRRHDLSAYRYHASLSGKHMTELDPYNTVMLDLRSPLPDGTRVIAYVAGPVICVPRPGIALPEDIQRLQDTTLRARGTRRMPAQRRESI